MAYAVLRKKQNHANLSKRKSFIMYVCVHSSEVWQRRHITIRSVPVQVETNRSTTKGKMLPCFTYVGQLLYVRCIFLLSAKQQRESLEIWKSDSSHSASCEVGYTSVLISLSLESLLGEDCAIFILCWIKRSSYSRVGCLYQMLFFFGIFLWQFFKSFWPCLSLEMKFLFMFLSYVNNWILAPKIVPVLPPMQLSCIFNI